MFPIKKVCLYDLFEVGKKVVFGPSTLAHHSDLNHEILQKVFCFFLIFIFK